MKESGKECLKYVVYESTRAPLTRSPFPNGEDKLVAATPPFWLTVFPYRQAFPSRGRCPEGADRAQAVGKRIGRSVSSRRFTKAPYPPLTRFPFSNGEGKLVAATDGILVSSAFPLRGRCPEGADRVTLVGKMNDRKSPNDWNASSWHCHFSCKRDFQLSSRTARLRG